MLQRPSLEARPFRKPSPVFIIGSVRSGTTLLRSVLNSGGELAIPPESFVLPEVITKFKNYCYLPWSDLVKLIIGEFVSDPFWHSDWNMDVSPCYERMIALPESERSLASIIESIYKEYSLQNYGEERRWGDKTPYNCVALPSLLNTFPDAQFVHIVRDGRDAVSSAIRAGIYDDIEEAARRWEKDVRACRDLGLQLPDEAFLEIKYEHFVTYPDSKIKELCNFLGVTYSYKMQEYYKSPGDIRVSYREAHKNLNKPISGNSIGSWKRRLSKGQVRALEKLVGSTLRELGYFESEQAAEK
ncbi:sulfotransferase family protein [Thiohalorhabdus methylotrophus]